MRLHMQLEFLEAFDYISQYGVPKAQEAACKKVYTVVNRGNIVFLYCLKDWRMKFLSFRFCA